ncbi:hypothetical protein CK203_049525 [Vitis vinifera]|uniref:Reverse transcriptase zinc-binding domain-containing protein n=1 Tax=Vitis vinifera TaxID=29760 RepID=A0A438HBC7_VITVI|nr:hypothetical protein CK203_049525 [Vitis vinifera]
MASAHHRNNSLERIKINGGMAAREEQEIREGIANAFHNLLSEDMGWKADIGRLQFDQISQQEAENLESCWDFIKEEVLEMFKDFYEHSSFLKSLNNTFLVLIPKKSGAEDLGDFRPISLLGGLYKLLAKVLANRLKKVLQRWVLGLSGWGGCGAAYPQLNFSVLVNGVPVGCNIRGGSGPPLNISHLFFADDTIIFFGEVVEMEELAVELGCRVGSLPSQYLGLPLGAPNRAPYTWDGVEERIRRRLALWKRQYISKGGRVTLIKNKDKGGLGLRKLAMLNRHYLASGYGGVWKEIWKESEWCWDNMMFRVGRATRSDFGQMNSTVEEMWDQSSGQGNWNLNFLRDFNDWELDTVGEFLHILRGHKPTLEEDSVLWRQGRSGQFRVKEAYRLLAKSNDTGFPLRSIWVARVPTKVAFFAWEATWGKVLTLDRFQRRGLQLPNCCFLCGCEEESVNHILIHCTVVRALWDIVFGLVM